ncbi:MAG: NUDIX domain-containing protein, partial [Trichodesmium sp. MAG_R04]|nr:NUDIX domain-containing protein [Trichodesmium sp. MAG_R04]
MVLPNKLIGVAVIWDETGKILIDKRRSGGSFAGLWEFPGGKKEAGETIEDCIKREVLEELGIEVALEEHLITIE